MITRKGGTTVWVVTYSIELHIKDSTVEGVFSTKEAAIEYVRSEHPMYDTAVHYENGCARFHSDRAGQGWVALYIEPFTLDN